MTRNATELLPMNRPFQVPDGISRVKLVVTDDVSRVGLTVGAFMSRSLRRLGIRLTGGCKGMSHDDKLDMIEYFVKAFEGYVGFASSGATRNATAEGVIDPMITDVPAALAAAYGEHVLTLSTAPRTGELALIGDGRLVLDDYDTAPQPGVHMAIIIQPQFSHETLGWDGDVAHYFRMFNEFIKTGGWQFGMTAWNGGLITIDEAFMAANYGWPVFIVQNSGRGADQIIELLERGTPIPGREQLAIGDKLRSRFTVVQRDDPMSLRTALVSKGFIAS